MTHQTHNFNSNDVRIHQFQTPVESTHVKLLPVTIKGHKFAIFYHSDLNESAILTNELWKSRLSVMASAFLTVYDYYRARGKAHAHTLFSIMCRPNQEGFSQLVIGFDNPDKEKPIDVFIAKKVNRIPPKSLTFNQMNLIKQLININQEFKHNQIIKSQDEIELQFLKPGEIGVFYTSNEHIRVINTDSANMMILCSLLSLIN